MKSRKINKKIILSLTGLVTVASISAAVLAACSPASRTDSTLSQVTNNNLGKNYDVGIAIDPINSLNYIKFASMRRISQTLVEGLTKEAPSPSSKIGFLVGAHNLNLRYFPPNPKATVLENLTDEDFDKNYTTRNLPGSFYGISNNGLQPGVVDSENEANPSIITIQNGQQKPIAMRYVLNNGASKWSNGEEINAHNFIDSVEYILDINTGSQLRTELLKLNIRGSHEINSAQEEYIRKHGKAYINPFGRANYVLNPETNEYEEDPNFVPFQSQTFDKDGNPVDEEEVAAIRSAVLRLGLTTGQVFTNITNDQLRTALALEENKDVDLTNIRELKTIKVKNTKGEIVDFKLRANRYFNRLQKASVAKGSDVATTDRLLRHWLLPSNRFELLVEFETYAPYPSDTAAFNAFHGKQSFLPINRKFVELNGGIHEFGSTPQKFLTAGPFVIEDAILGPEGYILLRKNKDYLTANWTLSDTIKIWFNSKNEVKSLYFEEGYISTTNIPASYQLKFWSQEKYRKLMKKQQGIGNVAIQFNLDPQSRYDSYEEYLANKDKHIPILDPDLRRALGFATNRESILRLTGWTASFPVNNWTAFGDIKDSRGKNLELWFEDKSFATEYKEDGSVTTNQQPLVDPTGKNGSLANSDVNIQQVLKTKTDFYNKLEQNNRFGYKEFPLVNNSFVEHSSKHLNFENIDRTDKAYDVDVANFYLDRYKKKHPELNKVKLTYVYASQPAENTKAAIAFQDLIHRNLGGYVEIELKALPQNTYVSFISSGKFDITYQNLDKYAGAGFDGSMGPFFISDGIDLANSKSSGYELNPSGAWVFKNFFDAYKDNPEGLKKTLERLKISNEDAEIIRELAYTSNVKTTIPYNPTNKDVLLHGKQLPLLDEAIPIFSYIVNAANEQAYLKEKDETKKANLAKRRIYLPKQLADQLSDNDGVAIIKGSILGQMPVRLTKLSTPVTKEMIAKDFDQELADKLIKEHKDRVAFEFDLLSQAKSDTYEVVDIQKLIPPQKENEKPTLKSIVTKYKTKLVDNKEVSTDQVNDLLFTTKHETREDHQKRIKAFFSSQRVGWQTENEIFRIITDLEKILREEMPILPIMDTDTNWTISSLGGVGNVYTYYLQFAYDYRNPPRPGLPRSPDEEAN